MTAPKKSQLVPEVWSFFAKRDRSFGLMLKAPRVEVLERTKKSKVDLTYVLPTDEKAAAMARSLIAGWKRAGYREVTQEAQRALGLHEGASVNEFPKDATYFVERKRGEAFVHAFALRGRELWLAGGHVTEVKGKRKPGTEASFGEIVGLHAHATAAAARAAYDEWVNAAPTLGWKPITRAELVALYR